MIARLLALCLLCLGGPAAAQTIALVADLNGRYGSTTYDERVDRAIESIVAGGFDAVLCAGDMVAGQSQPKLDALWLDSMWAGFNGVVHDPISAANIPFLVTAGNHDGSGLPKFALERERYLVQWQPRRPELAFLPGSEWPRRYAAKLGDILLVTFDGTVPGRLPPEELRFLERMLAANSPGARATVVFSHLPMWPFTRGREDDILEDPELLGLLHRHGVDVFASGHHHGFYAGVDIAGMVHVSSGALGGNVRPLVGERKKQRHSYVVLDFLEDTVRVESRQANSFTEPVPATALPAQLSGPMGILRRLEAPAPLR